MGVVLSLSPAVGSAAVPVKKGTYRGKTSQDKRLTLKMSGRSVRRQNFAETELRIHCPGRGPEKLSLIAFTVDARVTPSGRFRATEIAADTSPQLDDPFQVPGEADLHLVDVTRFEFSGRFVTRRRVRGHWRARSVLLYRKAAFESGEIVYDRCDTGDVTWSARLRRR